MYQINQRTWHDLPLNLSTSRNYDSSRPERVRFPGRVISDVVRNETRTGRNGNVFEVRLVNVIMLRTRLDGTMWLSEGWEPENFTFVRSEAIEGLDFLPGGEVLTIEQLQAQRANQPGPVVVTQRLSLAANTTFAPPATTPPVVEPTAPKVEPDGDDLDAHIGKAATKAK